MAPRKMDDGLRSVGVVRARPFGHVRRHGVQFIRKGFFVVFTRRRVLALVSVLMLALLLAACGGGRSSNESSSTSTTPSAAGTTTSSTASAREIEVVLDDFSFEPQEIRVRSGERVRLVIRNQGSVAHDWHVDALDLSSPLIQPGQSATFEFTAGAAGTYQTICTEPGHEALGMVGSLIIE